MILQKRLKNKVLFAPLELVLPLVSENSVDVTITSPPYKIEDGYTPQLMETLFHEMYRVHKEQTYAFVNFGHLVDFKARPFWLVQMAERNGWRLHETIIWVKPQFSPVSSNCNVNNLFEFIFMFRKGKPAPLDRLAIGVPYADKSNIKRYGRGKDLRCGGNVWTFGYETIQRSEQKLHPHRFPRELPRRCLKLVAPSLSEKPLVLDPFGGSFTTGCVAKEEFGYDFISCEVNRFNAITAAFERGLTLVKADKLLE